MTPPLVELVNAGAILEGRRVLHNLNWTLDRGCHWAVFGGNGAGKTTFLRLVAGQQWPAPGGLKSRRYDFGAGPEFDAITARRRMRLVGPELHDRYPLRRLNPTVATIIATGLQDSPILRVKPDAEQATHMQRLARQLGITSLLECRFLHLSRGQQRKALIARALIAKPDVLLLDEICEGLDQTSRIDLLDWLDELCVEGLQLVMATHHRHQLPKSVTHFIELRDGRTVTTGEIAPAPGKDGGAQIVESRRKAAGTSAPVRASRQRMPVTDSAVPYAPEQTEALITIRNGSLYRGTTQVLTAVDWQLMPGQHWQITGQNGSGKSTFLKLLHGDLRPARGGEIRWFGSGARVNVWRVRRGIGLISDELQSIYGDDIAVADCVATGFNASVGRVPMLSQTQIGARDTALEKTGLTALREISVRRLSYGQFRRVLLARALVQDPRVQLLDEPMTGLDAESRALIWKCISDLTSRGTQLVMASHEQDRGAVCFTHELRLADGRAREKPL